MTRLDELIETLEYEIETLGGIGKHSMPMCAEMVRSDALVAVRKIIAAATEAQKLMEADRDCYLAK